MSKYTCVDIYTHPQTFLPPSFFSIWLLSVSSTYNTWFVFILTICRSRKWISVFPCQFGHYQFQAIPPPLFVRLAAAAGRFLSFVSIWLYFIYMNLFLFFSVAASQFPILFVKLMFWFPFFFLIYFHFFRLVAAASRAKRDLRPNYIPMWPVANQILVGEKEKNEKMTILQEFALDHVARGSSGC